MIRWISLMDSKRRNVNMTLDSGFTDNRGTWRAHNPGMLNFNSGIFRSETWGITLLADDGRGSWTTVASFNNFWYVDGIYCNDSGTGSIMQGILLANDSDASWLQTA
jgi:hypothetical protein